MEFDSSDPILPGRRDYSGDDVEAARLVLLELAELLEEYQDGIVIIGGWVPYFLIPQSVEPHEGTKDIDMVLDAAHLRFDGDESIEELLTKSLFQMDEKHPFRWHRAVEVNGHWVSVVIEFLTPEIQGKSTGSLQRIQDVLASTMRGCEIALAEPREVILQSGSHWKMRVANGAQFLALKGMALHNRDGEATHDDARKDAYDIYYVIKNYPGGLMSLIQECEFYLSQPIFQEGLQKIAAKWQSIHDRGPSLVALREEDSSAQGLLRRDAFEQVRALLRALKVVE